MNRIINYISIVVLCSIGLADKVLINQNVEQIDSLSLSPEKIESIKLYIETYGSIDNIYDLLELENITSEDVDNLKSEIVILAPYKSDYEKKLIKNAYKIGQWISSEGGQEGISDYWFDRLIEPQNVNEMNYDDLINLPSVTPVDVVAVLKQQKRGLISGTFQLKNSPGISSYGYRNLRDLVSFEDLESNRKWNFRFSSLVRTIPSSSNPDSEAIINIPTNSSRPEMFYKFYGNYRRSFRFGFSYHRQMGENDFYYSNSGFKIPKGKQFASIENIKVANLFNIDKIILGNYSMNIGKGVVLSSGDSFSPRRTGLGFSKTLTGLQTDLSKSHQYVFNGLGIQASNNFFRAIGFASYAPRDAIVNEDGTFSTLIVMSQRFPWGYSGGTVTSLEEDNLDEDGERSTVQTIFHPLTSSVNELTYGTNLRFQPLLGTFLGFTFYESLYDRELNPKPRESIVRTADYDAYSAGKYLNDLGNLADSEIEAMYKSQASSTLWKQAKSNRRAIGFNFSTVINNVSFNAEYGELTSSGNIFKLGDEPNAWLASMYSEFNNLNFIVLFRDYDLEYDNPYQRSFSNYQRYKTTIFEDAFRLADDIFGNLFSSTPQPQSERGIFLGGRYKFHRSFTSTFNWDFWTRKADNARYYRMVTSLEYRPAYNFRIKLRQKFQARGRMDIYHPSPYDSRESRITARLNLSQYNQLKLLYSYNFTHFSPRNRLVRHAEDDYTYWSSDMKLGDVGSPDIAYGFMLTHNFTENFKMLGSILFIEGFFWNFEDTEFRVFSTESHLMHSWVALKSRLSNQLNFQIKLCHSHHSPQSNIKKAYNNGSTGGFGADEGEDEVNFPIVYKDEFSFRIQVDYAF